MVKDTYQFPTTLEKDPAPDNTREPSFVESFSRDELEQTTIYPERLKPYASIVRMGEQIRSYRDAALEEERLKYER